MNPPAGAIAALNASGPVIGGMNPPAGAIAALNASGPVIGGMNPPAGAIATIATLNASLGGVLFYTLLILVSACAPSGAEPDAGSGCPTHDAPSFEVGTGDAEFTAISEGMPLPMARGIQGGCHFWLALRTDGFADRGAEVRYEIFDAASGQSTGSTAAMQLRLTPSPSALGRCEYVGYTAFIRDPAAIAGTRVRIEVKLRDALGQSSVVSHEVLATWPEPDPSVCQSF